MLNSIAIWGGIVGMGVAVLALLLMVFTKKDIADIVNRDVILFDQNFALKKQAIEKAFKLLDDLDQNSALLSNAEYVKLAKQSYNELLCVMTNQTLAEQFKNLALKPGMLNSQTLSKYKFDCRRDIGLKTKYLKQVEPMSISVARPVVSKEEQPVHTEEAPQPRTTTRTSKKS